MAGSSAGFAEDLAEDPARYSFQNQLEEQRKHHSS